MESQGDSAWKDPGFRKDKLPRELSQGPPGGYAREQEARRPRGGSERLASLGILHLGELVGKWGDEAGSLGSLGGQRALAARKRG